MGLFVRPVSWGSKNGEQSHIARGGKGEVLKCVGSPIPSTRPFGSSLASEGIGTPKLSELWAGAIPGWVTPWEVAPELPETKPCGLVRM